MAKVPDFVSKGLKIESQANQEPQPKRGITSGPRGKTRDRKASVQAMIPSHDIRGIPGNAVETLKLSSNRRQKYTGCESYGHIRYVHIRKEVVENRQTTGTTGKANRGA